MSSTLEERARMIWLLGSVVVVVLGAGAAWCLLGPLARRAARPYITATTSPADDLESLTKIRGTLLQAAQGIVVVGGVLFTAGTLLYTASSVRLSQQTLDSTRDGQVTNRYTSAIQDLGSTNKEIRIGGMYALQRIGDDSPHDEPTVINVLAAFVRDHGIVGSTAVQDDENIAVEVLLDEATAKDPADLSGAKLPHLQQPNADMRVLNLIGADLEDASLVDANLHGMNLDGANLKGARLEIVNLESASLVDANLHGADLEAAHLYKADLLDADLGAAMLSGADLRSASLDEANLSGANLSGAIIRGADLTGTNLLRADLRKADMQATDLLRANLGRANLGGADLQEARAKDAHLEDADLEDADLHGANLSGADLQGADLHNANLSGADLAGANLKGALMPDATVHQ